MSIYLLDLSLRAVGHDYSMLWDAMRKANAQRLMDTTWLADVQQDIMGVTDALLSFCAAEDRLFVLELAPGAKWSATGMDDETKAWLAERISVAKVRTDQERLASDLPSGTA